jgi:predicted GNAT family acetyltransferase
MMDEVKLDLDEKGHGNFSITENDKKIAGMQISIHSNELTVYHTEVAASHEGKGMAKKLLLAMVDYARKNNLRVIALCPYVFAQFGRHPQEYADVWKNQPEEGKQL